MDHSPNTPAYESRSDAWQDLEAQLVHTRASANALAIVIEQIIESRHPKTGDDGYARLLVDEGALEAASYLVTDLLAHTREATDTYQAATGCMKRK